MPSVDTFVNLVVVNGMIGTTFAVGKDTAFRQDVQRRYFVDSPMKSWSMHSSYQDSFSLGGYSDFAYDAPYLFAHALKTLIYEKKTGNKFLL